MRVVAGEARQVNLSAAITASSLQNTLAAVQTTIVPAGGSSYTYSAALTVPTGSSAALDSTAIANPTFTPDVPGGYVVTITATDTASGATVTRSSTLEVRSPLSISLSSTSSAQDNLNAVATTVTPSGGLGTITYSATLTPPTGGTTTVTGGTTTTPSFTPDRAGGWRLTVTATDAAGQTATATRLVEVGTSALSVSIAAISDSATLPTSGTQALDSTVSNALGTVTYSWTGKDPAGNAISFSDATAADPTITYTSSQLPGLWTATVTVTDSARAQTASATVRWTTGGLPTATTPRAIYMSVVAGVLSWKEQILIGSHWVDASSYAACTTETDGSVVYAGTGLTIPTGLASSTTPQGSADERYMAFSSASAALQALVVAGARWVLEANCTSIANNDYARWGVAVTSAAGSFDAAGENLLHFRIGWDSTAYRLQIAQGSGSFNNADTSAALGVLQFAAQVGTANTGSVNAPAWGYDTSFSPGTTTPTRVYWCCSAQASAVGADTAVAAPWSRLAFYPVVS